MELPSSPSVSVIRTGLFERPRNVELIRHLSQNLIQKEFRVAVAASQVRRDGHCEILIRKLDSTACVEKSVDVVKSFLSVLQSARALTLKSPPLVELDDSSTDLESSVSILSPPPSVNRRVTFKRVVHDTSVCILDSEDEQADSSVLRTKRFCPLAVTCTLGSTDKENRNEESLVPSTSPKSYPVLSKDSQTQDKEEDTVTMDEGSKNITEPCSSKGCEETNPTETCPSQDQSEGTSAESMNITVPENGGDGSGSGSGGSRDSSVNKNNSSESSTSSEDEPDIIIDSVLNVNGKTPSIDLEEINCETDDEIIICGEQKAPVLNRSFSDAVQFGNLCNRKSMSRAQRKQERKISRQAGNLKITVASAGPSGFGGPLRLSDKLPDFIPLDSSGPNSRKFITKLIKQQKFEAKKQRKLNALAKAAEGAPLFMGQRSHKPGSSSTMGKGKKEKKAMKNKSNQKGMDKDHQEKGEKKNDGPSYDGNIMNPNTEPKEQGGLRPVVIDANNVAVSHGRSGKFSFRGLQICIQYFTSRGHKVVAVVPKFRRFHVSEEDRKALDALEDEGVVCYTPSRTMTDGRRIASYDDRFIVQVAAELGGVVVSTDNYRDLLAENENWRETIEQRLLMFTWVDDILMFPNDPLGRNGPHLSQFLRFPNPSQSQSTD